jgi:hypothetical protein
MNSADPQKIQGATAILGDIGGHEEKLRAAKAELKPAIDREIAARRSG